MTRIYNARMVWGWSIMTGSLLFKVGAAQYVAKLQRLKARVLQSITSTLGQSRDECEGCSAATAIIVLLVVIAAIWALSNS